MHRSNHTIDRATHYPRITSSRILGQEWICVMDAQPSTVVMRCNSESSGIHTYVRTYVWEANTMGGTATIISREYRGWHVDGNGVDSEISSSWATHARVIWSFRQKERARGCEQQRTTSPHSASRVLNPRCYPPRIALQLDLLCNLVTLKNSLKTRDECC